MWWWWWWMRIEVAAAVFMAGAAAVTFSVSGVEYQNVLPQAVLTVHLIESFRTVAGGPLGPHMVLECSTRCAALPSCTSFVLRPSTRHCFLTNLDRCLARKALLLKRTGYFYYEKFEAAEVPPPTCYASCLLDTVTCEDCGRPNCWGEFCEHCASFCWERRDMSETETQLLIRDMKYVSHTTCSGRWQLWWTAGASPPRPTRSELLVLCVVIIYADGRSLSAHFNMVQVKNKKLSVGNMTRDDGAGNCWGAPFDMRPLPFFHSDSCRPFYTPNDTCVSRTVPPAEEQLDLYNGTAKDQGFQWRTGNDSYDCVKITKIQLWVTCLQCVNETLQGP